MKYLIVAPAWVGDMVMAHTLVQQLLSQDSHANVHMLAPPATYPLALRMPGVAAATEFPLAHGELALGKRRSFAHALAQHGFEQAFVLPNSLKSALVPYWAKIKQRTGWHGESRYLLLNDRRRLDPVDYPLMIERFMVLALGPAESLTKPYPLPQLVADQPNLRRLQQTHDLDDQGAVALCPGAEFGPAKQWPTEHYATVARAMLEAGRQVWLLGSPKDATACGQIADQLAAAGVACGELRNLAGLTRLLDAVDLLSAASAVVCNDSGLMHVACALNRPVIALFGSTSPDFTPPLGANAQVLQHAVPCSPCFERQCPLGHLDCLQKLQPQRVVQALQPNLAQPLGLG